MSGKSETKPAPARPIDRRIRRTRDALGDALIGLMQERPFNSISVQQVLDRAGVSRSAFYAHYRDKEDLFLSDIEEFLESIGTLLTRRGAPSARLFPVEEFLSHIAGMPAVGEAIDASGKALEVRELAIGCFARSIEKRLLLAAVVLPSADLHATAHSLAGSLFSLLDWWLRNSTAITPKKLDAHFHRMAWRGLCGAPPQRS